MGDEEKVENNIRNTNDYMHDLGNSGDTEYGLENKNSDETNHTVSNKNVLDQMKTTVEIVKSKVIRFITLAGKKMGFSHL